MMVNREFSWYRDRRSNLLLSYFREPPNSRYQIQDENDKSVSVDSRVEASSASAQDTGFLDRRDEPRIMVICGEKPTFVGTVDTWIESILGETISCKQNGSFQHFNLGFKSCCSYMSTYGLNLGGLRGGLSKNEIERLRAPRRWQVGIQDQQAIRDVDPLATMAIHCSEGMESGGSTANALIPFQQHREVHSDVQISTSASEDMSSRVRNDGNFSRKGTNWIDERTRVILLSKKKSREGGCGDQSANQGQPERPLSEMKPANDVAGMRNVHHQSFRISDDVSYCGSSDLETEQTSTKIGDDLLSADVEIPPLWLEMLSDKVFNRPQAEATGDNFMVRAKGLRSAQWSADEMRAYLELKEEAMWAVEGKDWYYISQGLRERYGFDRSSNCCEGVWRILRKAYIAIQEHETPACDPQISKRVSFWEMDQNERSRNKLPLVFPLQWYKTMEWILAVQQEKRFNRKSRRIPAREPLRDEDDPYMRTAYPFGEGSKQQTEREPPRMTDRAETFVKQQVEERVNSALQSLPYSTDLYELLTTIGPIVKKQVEAAVTIELELLALTRVEIIDDEDSVTRLIPLVKQALKAAVNSALGPVASALQAWVHEEQVNQERLRVIQETRRALDLEEMQLRKRQRLGQHQRTWRTMFYKQQGARGKTSSQAVSSRH